MHRTHHVFNVRFWSLFLAVLAVGGLAVARAADDPPTRDERVLATITVDMQTTRSIQMLTGKKIRSANVDHPNVAQLSKDPNVANAVSITGNSVGLTRLELVDENGAKEVYQIIVEPSLDYVRSLVRINFPGSNVQIVALGAGSVLVSGYVDDPVSVKLIEDMVHDALGVAVRNNLRVIGPQQVQLNVKVCEVSRTKLREMSFAFQSSGNTHFIGSAMGLSSNTTSSSMVSPIASAAALTGGPGNLFLGLVNDTQAFWAFFQALKNDSLLKELASPTEVGLSGRQMSFLEGGEQAIPVPAGLGQVGVQFEEFGVRLNAVPTVLGNGRVRLELEPEVSALNAGFGTSISGTTVPGRIVSRVHTTVEMEVGQTYVIGGLTHTSVNASDSKVPVIGELPIIGALFSSRSYQETEDELLVMVTPFFVDALDCSQLPKLLPGQETRSPDDYELFLEGIMEAPRGLRPLCKDGHYNAAWKMSPTADLFPCGPCRNAPTGSCGSNGCGAAGCNSGCKADAGAITPVNSSAERPTPQAPPPPPSVPGTLNPGVPSHATTLPAVGPESATPAPEGQWQTKTFPALTAGAEVQTPAPEPSAPVYLPAAPGGK